jgi:hypothetical protein
VDNGQYDDTRGKVEDGIGHVRRRCSRAYASSPGGMGSSPGGCGPRGG